MIAKRRLRAVTIKRPLPGDTGNAFASVGHAIGAEIQPMSGTAAAQMYGLTPAEMRLMLCASGADILRGDGVCADVIASANPDYRVLYVAKWARHVVAHLKYIPEHERGAAE